MRRARAARALQYKVSATAAVAPSHVESDLHANHCCYRRTSKPPAPLTREVHASGCIRRARVTTPATLAILLTGDIIAWRYFAWRYFAGDILLANGDILLAIFLP